MILKLNVLSTNSLNEKRKDVKLVYKLKRWLTILSLKYLSSYLLSVNHLCFQFYKKCAVVLIITSEYTEPCIYVRLVLVE